MRRQELTKIASYLSTKIPHNKIEEIERGLSMKKIIRNVFSALFMFFIIFSITNLHILKAYAIEVTLSNNTAVGLQSEITKAGVSPTTIVISQGFSFNGTGISIPVNSNITIRSEGSSPVTLTQTSGRHFTVASNGSLTLEHIILDGSSTSTSSIASGGVAVSASASLTMNNGAVIQNCYHNASGGGVLMNGGTFTMNGGTITGSTAASGGGGVHMNSTGCTFNMYDGVITKNTAKGSTNAGSGVFVRGLFHMYGGEISNNVATASGASGGGVLVHENGTFIMGDDSGGAGNPVIKGNTAPLLGGGVYVGSGTFTMYFGEIKNNKAVSGGGVYSIGNAFTMSGGAIDWNEATAGNGGGVYTGSNFQSNISGGTINNNKASSYGGGIYANSSSSAPSKLTITGGKIMDNTADMYGGGIYGYMNIDINIEDGIISGNKALTGGGIYSYMNSTVLVKGIEITGNTATLDGGGIYGYTGSNITVEGGKINNNTAENSGGGIYAYSTISSPTTVNVTGGEIGGNKAFNGGGVYGYMGSIIKLVSGAISSNTATNGGGIYGYTASTINITGGGITDNKAFAYGGGVYKIGTGKFTMTGGEISVNKAESGDAKCYGGGVYLAGSSFIMGADGGSNDSVLIQNNAASYMGGGVDAHDGSSFTMNCGTISGNKALSGDALTYGGGVEVYDNSTFTMKNGIVTENASGDLAGGVEVYNNSTFTMDGGSVTKNTAPNGAGVSVGYLSAVFNMNGGELSNNTATRYGGGAYVYSSGLMNVTSGSISGNNAAYGGGVLTAETGQITTNNCSVTNNTATAGGGIYTMDINYSNLTTGSNTAFSGNTAASSYVPGADLDAMYPNIRYSSVSGSFAHPLNNFDINTRLDLASDCHVTFDSQGGTGVPDQIVEFGDRVTEPSDPTKIGYKFNGWWTNAVSGELWNFDTELVVEEHGTELVLYAHWEVLPATVSGTVRGLPNNSGVTINWSIDGGAATGATVTNENGDYSFEAPYDLNLSILPTARTGYSVSPESINIIVTADKLTGHNFFYTLNNITTNPTHYTVHYDANGGTGSHVVSDIKYRDEYTILSADAAGIYNDEKYAFIGWNTKENAAGLSYAPNQRITVTSDLTLYAQWTTEIEGTKPPLGNLPEDHTVYLIGYPDKSVRADNTITRAETAAIFFRLIDDSNKTQSLPQQFKDVNDGMWYTQYINYLASVGGVTVSPESMFRPDDVITRAEYSAIVSKLNRFPFTNTVTFTDVDNSHWAYEQICTAYLNGWINRFPDGTFRPDQPIERSQVVKIINIQLNRMIDIEELSKVKNPYNDIMSSHWAFADIMEASINHEYIREEDGTEIWTTE